MFEPSTAPRIFALPPGIRFAEALVAGLRARLAGQAPEAMARVTLLLGSGRMLRAVRAAFLDQGAGFLPRLRLVEDIAGDPALGLPPPAPPLRQRLQLARLVRHLVRHKAGFAPATAVIDLAESLRALFAEIHDEGVSAAAFEDRELALDHAAHWQAALAFIRIAAAYFEDAGTEADAALRQRRAVERLAEIWAAAPPETPVLVAGSTGSRGTTRRLMEIVARLPQGAVILPGYDYDMPETVWNSLCSGPIPPEEHPQFRFAAFRRLLGGGGAQPRLWHPAAPPAPERNRVVSLALRPAPVTDRWMQEGAALGDLREAMRDAALVVAPSPRQEAAAIAIRLREAAEAGRRAALVTPDRLLARRVTAILDRWRITPDDSAGEPLAQSAPGRLLRQVAGLIGQRIGMGDLLALLKNPLVATGGGRRGEHMRLTRDLELRLRRKGPAFPDAAFLRGWAKEAAAGRDGAGEAAGEAAADRAGWTAWLIGCLAAFDFPREAPLAAFAARHLEICERLAAGPAGAAEQSELWQKEAGGLAREAMAELAGEAAHGGALSGAEYAALVTGQLRAGMVRRTAAAHPAIAIWGTLEARVLDADLVILGGLNEGVWPASPGPDPWLSRQMRQRLGLRQPERQTGLSAHDFQQAACAPEVVFTRARRSADAETVPSRWLARLTNLLAGLPARHGPEALAGMEARGARLLALADELDQPLAAQRRP
ncbi:double-strand break repair protein AddB, partial [Albidovulum sp.]